MKPTSDIAEGHSLSLHMHILEKASNNKMSRELSISNNIILTPTSSTLTVKVFQGGENQVHHVSPSNHDYILQFFIFHQESLFSCFFALLLLVDNKAPLMIGLSNIEVKAHHVLKGSDKSHFEICSLTLVVFLANDARSSYFGIGSEI